MTDEKYIKNCLVDPQKWIETLPGKKSKNIITDKFSIAFCLLGIITLFLFQNDSFIIKYDVEKILISNKTKNIYYNSFHYKDSIKESEVDSPGLNKKQVIKSSNLESAINSPKHAKNNKEIIKRDIEEISDRFKNWSIMQIVKAMLGLPPTVVK